MILSEKPLSHGRTNHCNVWLMVMLFTTESTHCSGPPKGARDLVEAPSTRSSIQCFVCPLLMKVIDFC